MMRIAREDWRHLALIVLVWGLAGFVFGIAASELIAAVAEPTVPTVEQTQPPQP